MKVPAEALDGKLASLPKGVSVSRDRIEVRFNGAKDAVGRLYALGQALVNDYERFEALVDGGVAGGGEGVRMSEALVPAAVEPAVVAPAGDRRGGAGCGGEGSWHDVPAHRRAAEAPRGERLTGRALTRRVVLAMIKRRAAAGLPPSTRCSHVPGDGDHGVSIERADLPRARPDCRPCLAEDNESCTIARRPRSPSMIERIVI